MKRVLIAGCGFLGEAAARFFLNAGWEVTGLVSSEASATALASRGIKAFACDLGEKDSVRRTVGFVGSVDLWIHCASTGGGGSDAYRRVYLGGVRSLLEACPGIPGIFTGSTSVYAQVSGEDVDETSLAAPVHETGQILLEAERVVLDSGGAVLRLAGIYGPGRSALLRKFLDGSARIEGDGSRWINQIHHRDAARSLLHLASGPFPHCEIFNCSDDTPLRQIEIYTRLAALLARPLPPSAPIDPMRKRGWSNKRVLNGKLRSTGWQPEFPSFFSALHGNTSGGVKIS
jgi:nucleoside-diphosphate-sugar epimerase